MDDGTYLDPREIAASSKQEQYLNEAREHNQLLLILKAKKQTGEDEKAEENQTFFCCGRPLQI
jgi:hypothetical protein